MTIKITSDSTCDLSKELLEKHNITLLPLTVIKDNKPYSDGVDITPADIFAHVAAGGDLCSTTAYNIEEYLRNHVADVESLADEMNFIVQEISNDNSLSGLKFCITGSFSQPRDSLKKALEAKGAKFISSVSKNLDILFAGDKAGSKLTKAQQLGVKIANEDELMNMLNK